MYTVAMDETLLKGLRSKDADALKSVVEEHTEFLLRAALGMGFPIDGAEDLVQETFLTFLSAVERFEGRSTVRTFLYGILYRKGLERRRKGSRELATDPIDQVFESRFDEGGMWRRPPEGPEDALLSSETGKLIGECLEGLTPAQRNAFHLKEVEIESNESICNILEITNTHLRVLLFRARNKLRECLEGKWTK